MNNKEWIELIEKSREEIIDKGYEAYKDALYNPHLRFIVELDKDGNVDTWYDIAGGNSFQRSTYSGDSIEVLHLCFKNQDVEVIDGDLINKLGEKNMLDRLVGLEEDASENGTSLEVEMLNDDVLKELVYECEKEQREFEVNEYARTECDIQIDTLLENMIQYGERYEKMYHK